MNDAVYRRQKKVEKTLDVKLEYNPELEADEYAQLFKAGDDLYQELHFHIITNVADYVTAGYLYNADTLPYVDFSADWYNQENIDALRMGKNTYYIASDYVITNPAAVIFNKDMIVDNNFENPYDLVKAGTWTIDKMIQMAIDVRQDVSGDGEYTSEDDIYGIQIAELSLPGPFFIGVGQTIGTRNADTGKYEITMNNEFTYSAWEQLYRLSENKGAINFQIVDFDYGTSLFQVGFAENISQAADITEFEIGIVPYPKLNEEQDRYYSRDVSGLMAISGTIKNPEMVGAVVELLAWESGNEVVDTYYNKLLKTRYASDLETRKMVELIFDTVTYDALGNYFGFKDGICALFYAASQPMGGHKNAAAFFRTNVGQGKGTLANFYTELEKIEAGQTAE